MMDFFTVLIARRKKREAKGLGFGAQRGPERRAGSSVVPAPIGGGGAAAESLTDYDADTLSDYDADTLTDY